MKKLLLVALFVAVPALVLAQGTTTSSKPEAKAPAAKVESTTTAKASETAKPKTEAAKTEGTKKVETATTTKTTEATKTATTETKPAGQPEMILIGEIEKVDNANKTFTLKVKDTNKSETISFKEVNPNLKEKTKVKATYEKDANGKLWLKKFEEQKY